MKRLRPLIAVGTRPEAIKLAPLILAARQNESFAPLVLFTGQHREMLSQVADYFQIVPDIDLEVMRPNQSLAGLTARCLEGIDRVIDVFQPDSIIAQGDTTTVLACGLVAFYRRIPLVHVEAGLRTGNLLAPFPEEFNRRVASLATTIHCAPTERAAQALRHEGIDPDAIHVTGNTVIDALHMTIARERLRTAFWQQAYNFLGERQVVLITGHRRENFGEGFSQICEAISLLAGSFPEVEFVYPVHLNPNVQQPVRDRLGTLNNVHLLQPSSYPEFVWLMDRAKIILTDSGGVQEEAPSLGKPVLVMRDTTERPEAVEAGAAKLVGTGVEAIVTNVSQLLTDDCVYQRFRVKSNPYGDGQATQRILKLIQLAASNARVSR
jgi:UDP-N-acetylglucosamine 2-epimerase (non-hydrolysing)